MYLSWNSLTFKQLDFTSFLSSGTVSNKSFNSWSMRSKASLRANVLNSTTGSAGFCFSDYKQTHQHSWLWSQQETHSPFNHIFIFKLTMIFLQSVASKWLVKRVQIKYLSMKYMIPAPLSRTTCKLGSSLLPWQGKLRDFRRVTWRRFFVRLFYAPLGYTSQNSQTNKDKIRETLCRIPRYTLRSRIKPGQRVFSLAFWVLVI